MDLALAHFSAKRFNEKGTQLNPWQSISLWHACRSAKEGLLSGQGIDPQTISVLGRGSKLIGGTVSITLSKAEAEQLLVDGFFPLCAASDRPTRRSASGFQELGLPFESDTAVTRHVAGFLQDQNTAEQTAALPSKLLFNGGVFQAKVLRERMIDAIGSWSASGHSLSVLGGPEDLDRAVACGAAYYGWSKQHGGVRIRGGTAPGYYVGIETAGLAVPGMPRPLQALCVVPFGMEEGTSMDVPSREVGLVVGQQASFRFFASPFRKSDRVGTILRVWDDDELVETAPLVLELPATDSEGEQMVPVRFQSRITELGVFELWCVGTRTDQRWKLEFNIRA